MKIVNIVPSFDPLNNGWIYIGNAEDGTLWVRSVAGKWAQIKSPVDVSLLSNEFEKSSEATLQEVKSDNTDQSVKEPTAEQAEAIGV